MKNDSGKHFYKGISLFLKAAIFIFSIVYIFYKLYTADIASFIKENSINFYLLFIALILVIFNWGLEAYKWKLLIEKLEKLSFSKAYQSVLSGLSIGIFTPNRIGEFAGRIFFLEHENKIKATFIYFIGSAFQLLITIAVGILAAVYFVFQNPEVKNEIIQLFFSKYVLIIFFLTWLLIVLLFILRKKIKLKYAEHIDVFFSYSKYELTKVFFYSLLRYLVFTLQYYLVLKSFGVELDLITSATLIALTFFVSSAIPSFAFTEMSVRGASAMYFFSFFINDTSVVLAASIVVWLINLAIPAVIGLLYVGKLKFFKE